MSLVSKKLDLSLGPVYLIGSYVRASILLTIMLTSVAYRIYLQLFTSGWVLLDN